MEITVVDRNGWKKPYKLHKAVLKIGSNAANDIQLISPDIAPVHLQIIQSADTPASCKVLNLGQAVPWTQGGRAASLEPYAGENLQDGSEIQLGEYRILFHLPLSGGNLTSSRQFSAVFSLADPVLRPGAPATGIIHVKNLGASPQCQFQVTLSGLHDDCYSIDPPPLLYSGGEDEVRLQFFHLYHTPQAGVQTITLKVTAPLSYPGELVTMQQDIQVAPFVSAALHLADDLPAPLEISSSPALATAPATASPDAPETSSVEESPPSAAAQEPEPAFTVVSAQPTPFSPVKETTAAKVLKNPAESYWDE